MPKRSTVLLARLYRRIADEFFSDAIQTEHKIKPIVELVNSWIKEHARHDCLRASRRFGVVKIHFGCLALNEDQTEELMQFDRHVEISERLIVHCGDYRVPSYDLVDPLAASGEFAPARPGVFPTKDRKGYFRRVSVKQSNLAELLKGSIVELGKQRRYDLPEQFFVQE